MRQKLQSTVCIIFFLLFIFSADTKLTFVGRKYSTCVGTNYVDVTLNDTIGDDWGFVYRAHSVFMSQEPKREIKQSIKNTAEPKLSGIFISLVQ